MKYIKVINGEISSITVDQIFNENKGVHIYKLSRLPNEELLKNYNIYPLITTPKIQGDVVEEGVPELIEGKYYQTWVARDFTEEERLDYEEKIKIQEDLDKINPSIQKDESN